MNKSYLLCFFIFCSGCKKQITPIDLKLLNGYWNIDFVAHKDQTFYPKGTVKLLDYYNVEGLNGARKKVQPQFENKFLITEDLNNFKVIFKSDNCYLSFETVWDQWQEKIVELSTNKLVLEHQDKRFHYKRFLKK